MVPRCFKAFGLNTALEGIFPFQQVGCHVTQDPEIFRCMIFTYPAVVFSERYIKAPVQAVFDTPVISDRFRNGGCMVFETGYEIGRFCRDLSISIPLSENHANRFNTRPLFFTLKPADIVGCEVMPGFDTAVLTIKSVDKLEGAIGRLLEEKSDVFVECFLIIFDLDNIIGSGCDNCSGDFFSDTPWHQW